MKMATAILTFLAGLYFFLEFLLPEQIVVGGETYTFGLYHQEISLSLALISSLAVGLGVINILLVHGRVLLLGRAGWSSSLGLVVSFFVALYVLFAHWLQNVEHAEEWSQVQAIAALLDTTSDITEISGLQEVQGKAIANVDILIASTFARNPYWAHITQPRLQAIRETLTNAALTEESISLVKEQLQVASSALKSLKVEGLELYQREEKKSALAIGEDFIFSALFLPLSLSMFSILGFYVVSAAYRSFRLRSLESGIMMATALLVVLGQIPQGVQYLHEGLPGIRLWLFDYISTPAFRAIYFTSVVAALSLAVRMWLSIDKNPFISGSR